MKNHFIQYLWKKNYNIIIIYKSDSKKISNFNFWYHTATSNRLISRIGRVHIPYKEDLNTFLLFILYISH